MILIVSCSVIDLGPLGLDEDIYNTRGPCTWLVHVLRHREYRLSDNYTKLNIIFTFNRLRIAKGDKWLTVFYT